MAKPSKKRIECWQGDYYPQYKGWFLWNCYDWPAGRFCVGEETVKFPTLNEASEYLQRKHAEEVAELNKRSNNKIIDWNPK